LYLAGRYDDALELLRDALELYPLSAELHVGVGYARLAREEFAWSRLAFEEALGLEPNQEDALAGVGETLIKLGQHERGWACFDRIIALGFAEDHDLMLQIGRTLFRENMFDRARSFFELAVEHHMDSAEASACLGYAAHRLGDESGSIAWLRRALEIDPSDAEANVYLGNLRYDRGEYDDALAHFERTVPADHLEELAIWRYIELKKAVQGAADSDAELRPWLDRFAELTTTLGPEDRLLAEISARLPDGTVRDPRQLDFFATLLTELQGMKRRNSDMHDVELADGTKYFGTWDDIVLQMKQDDADWAGGAIADYMEAIASRSSREHGVHISITDAESFIRGIAAAGLATIMT
jgi:tetratricopeptide (TPR) repeat protein